MSGTNPFRRRDNAGVSQIPHNPVAAAADRAELRFPPIDTHVPKSGKGKTVRIVSPHYSRSGEGHSISSISPPPPRDVAISSSVETNSPSEEPSPLDPFSAHSDEGTSQDDDEDDDLRRNTIANATTSTSQILPGIGMPVKTARKALVLDLGAHVSNSRSSPQTEPSFAPPAAKRPQYGVDDFKRLLLTGQQIRTGEVHSATRDPAHNQALQLGDSDSHTDASSVSRQSIFEPHPDGHAESSSTSMNVPLTEDKRRGLLQPSSQVGRNRPSVPLSHHGNLVEQNAPQTVAFGKSPPPSPPGLSVPSASLGPLIPPSTPHHSKTLNKPLPPPLRTEQTSVELRFDLTANAANVLDTSSTSAHRSGQGITKRSPPALPPARRHPQGRSRSSTNESSRSTSLSEDLSQYTHPSPTNSSSTTSSKPPPLPPPRRAGSNTAPEKTDPSSSAITTTDFTELPASKPRPPAPPSRTSSTTSIKRISRISTNSGSSGPAPPPPPRRRGSSQSQFSFAPSGLSGEHRIASNERARSGSSASSTHQPLLHETPMDRNDIMMDLTTLQREVDELRGKFSR
ncbi:MAG: hypothetical protein Q9177_000536 [Variospora cf. flavescens]